MLISCGFCPPPLPRFCSPRRVNQFHRTAAAIYFIFIYFRHSLPASRFYRRVARYGATYIMIYGLRKDQGISPPFTTVWFLFLLFFFSPATGEPSGCPRRDSPLEYIGINAAEGWSRSCCTYVTNYADWSNRRRSASKAIDWGITREAF